MLIAVLTLDLKKKIKWKDRGGEFCVEVATQVHYEVNEWNYY